MTLQRRLRNLEVAAEGEMIAIPQIDGTVPYKGVRCGGAPATREEKAWQPSNTTRSAWKRKMAARR